MRRMTRILGSLLVLVALVIGMSNVCFAEATYEKRSITLDTAKKMLDAVERKAREIGVPMSMAIMDENGVLKAFRRMDGATLSSTEVAKDKAYSAVGFGMPTDAWYDFIKDDKPLLLGVTNIPRLMIFGGGYPIVVNQQVVGAIGVSGGYYTQDMECAQAGLGVLKPKERKE